MRRGIDYHIHTFYQRCGNETLTVEAIIRKAESLQMTSIAITDHLNTLDQLPNFRLIKRDIEAVETALEVFFGVELNFQSCDGEWAYSAEIRDEYGFEVAVGGIHSLYTDSHDPVEVVDIQHRHHLRTLCDPLVDVLVHPWWVPHQEWLARPAEWWEVLLEDMPEARITELADASRANACPIELNAEAIFFNTGYTARFRELYVEYVARLRDAGALFTVASDAHDISALGHTDYVEGIVDGLGIPEERIWKPTKKA